MTSQDWITITRPDGQKLFINKFQIVYVMRDPIDESGQKTEIMTNQGSFQIKIPVESVIEILQSNKRGDF